MFQIKNHNDLMTARSLLKVHNKRKLSGADKRRLRNFYGLLSEYEIESYIDKPIQKRK